MLNAGEKAVAICIIGWYIFVGFWAQVVLRKNITSQRIIMQLLFLLSFPPADARSCLALLGTVKLYLQSNDLLVDTSSIDTPCKDFHGVVSDKAIDQLHSPGENFLVQFQDVGFVAILERKLDNMARLVLPKSSARSYYYYRYLQTCC